MRKFSAVLIYSLFFCSFILAQENSDTIENIREEQGTENIKPVPIPVGFYIGSQVIVSNTGNKVDTPAGIAVNFGGEYEYRALKHLNFSPSLDFSFFHYGLINGRAHICEIENRTALTFTFSLDMPVLASFDINRWNISFGGGLVFLVRFGILDLGVKPEEKNSAGVTAKEEVKKINSFFWKNGRFIYPSFRFKAAYTFESGWKIGLQTKFFLPICNLWDKTKPKFSDGMIVQIGIIIHPAKRKKIKK